MGRAASLLAVLAAAAGCEPPPSEPPPLAEPLTLSVVSYNVANATGDAAELVADQLATMAPDFAAVQECGSCSSIAGDYALIAGRAGVALLYDDDSWQRLAHGVISLGNNDDGWGERVALWGQFANRHSGGQLTIYSTHWCVPIRADDDACDDARQMEYADRLLATVPGRAVVAGDLNVFDGFEDGEVIARLRGAGLVDAYRVAEPSAGGDTFTGNDWAPPGRIDYIFATPPVEVIDAYIDRDSLPAGAGSDHYPVFAALRFVR
jgi:endonuclease/exonuclease/phosphatase family metal-dependent hydrolase